MTAQHIDEHPSQVPPVPPLRPDPEIMDNAEGNDSILRHDKSAATAYLKDQDDSGGAAAEPRAG